MAQGREMRWAALDAFSRLCYFVPAYEEYALQSCKRCLNARDGDKLFRKAIKTMATTCIRRKPTKGEDLPEAGIDSAFPGPGCIRDLCALLSPDSDDVSDRTSVVLFHSIRRLNLNTVASAQRPSVFQCLNTGIDEEPVVLLLQERLTRCIRAAKRASEQISILEELLSLPQPDSAVGLVDLLQFVKFPLRRSAKKPRKAQEIEEPVEIPSLECLAADAVVLSLPSWPQETNLQIDSLRSRLQNSYDSLWTFRYLDGHVLSRVDAVLKRFALPTVPMDDILKAALQDALASLHRLRQSFSP